MKKKISKDASLLYAYERALEELYPCLKTPIGKDDAKELANIIWATEKHEFEARECPDIEFSIDFKGGIFESFFADKRACAYYHQWFHSIYALCDEAGSVKISTLLHEMAHALRQVHHDEHHHGEEFAKTYFHLIERYFVAPVLKTEKGIVVPKGNVVKELMESFYEAQRLAA